MNASIYKFKKVQPYEEYTPSLVLFLDPPLTAAADRGGPRQLPENASWDPESWSRAGLHGGKTEPTVSPAQPSPAKSARNRSINIYNRRDMSGNILNST